MIDALNGLCQSPFWDSNLTWYTDSPEFTPCFHNTALVWIPCAVFWLFSPIQVVLLLKAKVRNTSWTKLFLVKIGIILILNVICSANLILSLHEEKDFNLDTVGYGLKFGTYILVILYLLLERARSFQPSSFLLFYWFIAVISDTFTIRWRINSAIAESIVKDPAAFSFHAIHFILIFALFALSFLNDKRTAYSCVKETNTSNTYKQSPEVFASVLSRLTFSWLTETIWRGWKTPLRPSDVFGLLPTEKTLKANDRFEKFWKYRPIIETSDKGKEVQSLLSEGQTRKNISSKDVNPTITYALLRAFGPTLFLTILLRIIADALLFSNPQFIRLLIEFASNEEPLWKGILYASLMFLVNVAQCLISQLSVRITTIFGVRLKSALMYSLYQKVLRISYNARENMTVGKIINTMTVDASKFDMLAKQVNMAWAAPTQIVITFYFLWTEIGVAITGGIFVMLVSLPLNTFMANKAKVLQGELMKVKDNRLKIMSEVLNGIRVLKMYAWEKSFEKIILEYRQREIFILRKQEYILLFIKLLHVLTPVSVSIVSFVIYVLQDESNILTPEKAFLCLIYFNMMRRPFIALPEVISKCIMARVSIQRISRVLNCNEYQDYTLKKNIHPNDIVVEEGSFRWKKGLDPTLNEISFSVSKGSLVAIVGPVGCGKSSLLSSLLCEMEKVRGEVTINGTIGYVPQQAWILNKSFRENITFLKSKDETRYQQVVKACALETDLETMPAHDNTEIGENGINLSGGQKQRVSLARAVYLDDDIYLLDDPLGAVDAHVGRHIFEHVIGPNGMLKGKTRILVTNNLAFLPQVDQIFFMDSGRIVKKGSLDEIVNSDEAIREFITNHMNKENLEDENLEDETERHWDNPKDKEKMSQNDVKQKSKIISAEKMEKGKVSLAVYRDYFEALGTFFISLTIAAAVAQNSLGMFSSYWLALWSEDSLYLDSVDTSLTNWRLTIYGVLGFGQSFMWGFTILLSVIACLRASLTLHSRMLERILHSPSIFFDTTPTGRVLNRFSRDVDVVDSELPAVLKSGLLLIVEFIVTAIGVCLGIPFLLIPVILSAVGFAVLQRFYVATSRQLKRITSTRHSFVVSHFSTSLGGESVVRACKASRRFLAECRQLIDNSLAVFYLSDMCECWLNVRIGFLANFLLFCAAVFTAVAKGSLSPGIVAFIISNLNLVLQYIPLVIRYTIAIENCCVSVERIYEYSHVPSEAPWETQDLKLPASWPKEGKIEFRNLSVRYRVGLDLVLKSISFAIGSKEKVGIVGRTGAGKTSITQALFRLIEPASGQILIDDLDICQVGLHDLRSRLTIIPQDPVLFSGSLRLNLDPFDKYSDGEIWSALEHSHLKPFIKSLEKGLDHEIAEGGNNLSVGQRQLVCLTRALLRRTQILVLDEATASVDMETDELIQRTIRQEFSSSTVLTIAHRLNTIMDYDRVLVLDSGNVSEFDNPSVLLQREDSVFYSLAKSANLVK